MAYSTDILNDRIKVLNRSDSTVGAFGVTDGEFIAIATIWANVTWVKGIKSMREGALEAYDTIMIRTRYNLYLKRDSRIEHDGRTYIILSYHADRQNNTIQVTAQELTA